MGGTSTRRQQASDIGIPRTTVVAETDAVKTVREAHELAMAGVASGGVRSRLAAGSGADVRVERYDVDACGRVDPALAGAFRLQPGDTPLVSA